LIAAFASMHVLRKQFQWSNTGRPHRLGRSRTPGFQPGNRGSNPLGAIDWNGQECGFLRLLAVFLSQYVIVSFRTLKK
jgi:hypothetical protein